MSINFKQGEDITLDIIVTDESSNPITVSGFTSVSVSLFIKESLMLTFSSGLTCTMDEDITSYSGNTIKIDLTRDMTKNFPVGEITAKILIDKNNIVKEYSYIIGDVTIGYMKNKTI